MKSQKKVFWICSGQYIGADIGRWQRVEMTENGLLRRLAGIRKGFRWASAVCRIHKGYTGYPFGYDVENGHQVFLPIEALKDCTNA